MARKAAPAEILTDGSQYSFQRCFEAEVLSTSYREIEKAFVNGRCEDCVSGLSIDCCVIIIAADGYPVEDKNGNNVIIMHSQQSQHVQGMK